MDALAVVFTTHVQSHVFVNSQIQCHHAYGLCDASKYGYRSGKQSDVITELYISQFELLQLCFLFLL
jgi:hypothetical protein